MDDRDRKYFVIGTIFNVCATGKLAQLKITDGQITPGMKGQVAVINDLTTGRHAMISLMGGRLMGGVSVSGYVQHMHDGKPDYYQVRELLHLTECQWRPTRAQHRSIFDSIRLRSGVPFHRTYS